MMFEGSSGPVTSVRGQIVETLVIWLKVVHIAALSLWVAGLFALPALLAAHPRVEDRVALRHLRAKTRFTYVGIASPAAVIAVIAGTALIWAAQVHGAWLFWKLVAVTGMVVYHVLCGWLLGALFRDPFRYPSSRLASLVVAPAILAPLVIWLVTAKPG